MEKNKLLNKLKLKIKFIFFKIFKFQSWHVGDILIRDYSLCVIEYLNKSQYNNVLDVGCGFGDILSHIKSKKKIGIDNDIKIINAAKLYNLFKLNTKFYNSEIYDLDSDKKFDLIILLNFTHNIEPTDLKNLLNYVFNSLISDRGKIIIDTVGDISYNFNHDINFLMSKNISRTKIIKIGTFKFKRDIFCIEKVKKPN